MYRLGRSAEYHSVEAHDRNNVCLTGDFGGREGIRTLGLLVANEALSQLSYSPIRCASQQHYLKFSRDGSSHQPGLVLNATNCRHIDLAMRHRTSTQRRPTGTKIVGHFSKKWVESAPYIEIVVRPHARIFWIVAGVATSMNFGGHQSPCFPDQSPEV